MANRQADNYERPLPGQRGRRWTFFPWGMIGGLGVLLLGCTSPQAGPEGDYAERYLHPLSSPGAQFGQLPPAVKSTVLAETGSAVIVRIDKGTSSGKTVYRIAFQNAGVFPPLYLSADGAVLYPNLNEAVGAPQDVFTMATHGPVTRVSLDELPIQVVKAIQRARPDAEVDVITREASGARTLYVVTFKGRMHPSLTLAPDGTIEE